MTEPNVVEAVILSGPRRGEIVSLDLEQHETLTEEQMGLVSEALRKMDAALIELIHETRLLKADLKSLRDEVGSPRFDVGPLFRYDAIRTEDR